MPQTHRHTDTQTKIFKLINKYKYIISSWGHPSATRSRLKKIKTKNVVKIFSDYIVIFKYG